MHDIFSDLTDEERRVRDLILEYRTNDEIARELGITPGQARKLVHRVYEKSGIRQNGNRSRLYFFRKFNPEKE